MISRKKLADVIRILSIDAIQKAKSGHPGAPMGMADIAEVLWRDYLIHNPNNPKWINRDRFILSNGHASMLLYSLLHLTGYNITIDDIKQFRRLNSKTPGHPESLITEGVETTTGPLGQGLANAVGIAIAEKTLSAQFNRKDFNIIDHYTYVFVGDGCIMEGISHEACSLAGKMNLGKLIVFYDKNNISIDGNVKDWFIDDTNMRFRSYEWHVIDNIDGHNSEEIKNAIDQAKLVSDKPSLLICNTIIAFGSPNKSGTHYAHGSPLGEEEIIEVRKYLEWNEKPFVIPLEIYNAWNAIPQGKQVEDNWNNMFTNYKFEYPDLAKELIRRIHYKLPKDWDINTSNIIKKLQKENNDTNNIATRQASQNVLESFGPMLPELLGGSADLSPSNLTIWSRSSSIIDHPNGNYIHYGVREFGMTAIGNGIAQYGGFIPYTATFLTFSEYARNAIRMAALMKSHHIMIYTHDSIGLGEDGPTHQPIEQISTLRLIPGLINWRPCDAVETAVAWKFAIENNGPTTLILSRQNVCLQKRNDKQIENIYRGGYILIDSIDFPDLILIGTGSEVELAIMAQKILHTEGYNIRVISMPSTNIFDKQDKSYRDSILPQSVPKIAIEAGISDFWYKYVGTEGKIIGIDCFGESAPAQDLWKHFNFTVDHILKTARIIIK